MKLTYALMIVAAIAVTSGTDASGQNRRLSDVGAAHNFTDDVYQGGRDPGAGFYETDWNTTGEICQPCHTPHGNGGPTGTMINGLLWSHDMSSLAGFTMYTSPTMNSVNAAPLGWDKLCLSCHDGEVGIDAFAHNEAYAGAAVLLTVGFGTNVWGYDLYASHGGPGMHPISVDYDADPGMNDKNTTPYGLTGFVVDALEGGNMMGCYSCHDVHEDSVPDTVTTLLRVDNAGSLLCLACHDK